MSTQNELFEIVKTAFKDSFEGRELKGLPFGKKIQWKHKDIIYNLKDYYKLENGKHVINFDEVRDDEDLQRVFALIYGAGHDVNDDTFEIHYHANVLMHGWTKILDLGRYPYKDSNGVSRIEPKKATIIS